MEKKLYEFIYQDDFGKEYKVNVRFSDSEIKLLEWLEEQCAIGEFTLTELDEVEILEF